MANNFLTLKTIARKALPRLMDELVFPNLVYRDYSDAFSELGDTVQVRKPVLLTATDFDEANGVNYQDIKESSVDVKLENMRTTLDRTLSDVRRENGEQLDKMRVVAFVHRKGTGVNKEVINTEMLAISDLELIAPVLGDLNDDGNVDVDDLNIILNMMLANIDKADVADITGDGNIDSDDVNAIINIMLRK